MDSKTAEFLSKLVLEDDEDDLVSFAFPNEKRKIKCSISMLAEISPVFEAMFSTRWIQKNSEDDQLDVVPHEKALIKLDDDVTFNQYLTFKLFMQILYGLRQTDSLSVDQATGVYFYSHKYQIEDVEAKIQNVLNKRMESGMSKLPLSVTELKESIEFAHSYNLDEFKKQLDRVKLDFNEENPIQFWDLVSKFDMKILKQQVIGHLKAIPPEEDWTTDILIEILTSLQAERELIKKTLEEAKCGHCNLEYSLYCDHCEESNIGISSLFSNL